MEQTITPTTQNNHLTKQTFITDHYQKLEDITDNRFGDISLWSRNEDNHLLLQKQQQLDDPEDVQETIEQAKERMKLNYEYMMKMADYSVEVLEANVINVSFFYEAPHQDLKKEIQLRREQNK
jgi:hypothetical protein